MISRRILPFLALVALCSCKKEAPPQKPAPPPPPVRLGVALTGLSVEEGIVLEGATFGSVLAERGLGPGYVQKVVDASKGIFDPRRLRAGDSIAFFLDSATKAPRSMVLRPDPFSRLRFDFDPVPVVRRISPKVDTTRVVDSGTISSSLWVDMTSRGISPAMVGRVSDILAWEVDFFALQPGDKYCLVFDRLSVEGRPAGEGIVHGVRFSQGVVVSEVYRFSRGNVEGYYDPAGHPARKAFLKAPLQFSRISSRFTGARLHPVLRIVRPHYGVDYAAPAGTPIVAIGEGSVVEKGWMGGGGNGLKIRHPNGYVSGYMHLSRFAPGIGLGKHLRQGDQIGFVGSTGLATGPHLDFRFWLQGRPVDPLHVVSPPSPPLPDSLMTAFRERVTVVRGAMSVK